jgi:hypothetical protein
MSLDLVAESQWNRRRKLLPKLKLEYPSDPELRELAALAKVDEPSIFGQHIQAIILTAHLNDASLRTLSIPKVRKTLNKVMNKAQQLRNALRDMDVGTKGSAERAGMLLEYEIRDFRFREGMVLIPEYVQLLKALNDAAHRAAQLVKTKRRRVGKLKLPRGPKGVGGNPAFNLFIESMLMAVWQRRGDWTNYKSADGTWTGTLLEALKLLQRYLPSGLFPGDTELGRSVEHVRKKFKDYIKKERATKKLASTF